MCVTVAGSDLFPAVAAAAVAAAAAAAATTITLDVVTAGFVVLTLNGTCKMF